MTSVSSTVLLQLCTQWHKTDAVQLITRPVHLHWNSIPTTCQWKSSTFLNLSTLIIFPLQCSTAAKMAFSVRALGRWAEKMFRRRSTLCCWLTQKLATIVSSPIFRTSFTNCVVPIRRAWRKIKRNFVRTACNPCWKNFNNLTRVCSENTPLQIELPSPETKLKFCKWQKTPRCTFTVYAYLEALLVPVQKSISRCTIIIENQFPAIYGAVLVDSWSNSVLPKSLFIVLKTVSTNCASAWEDGWNFVMEKIKYIVIWKKSWAQNNGSSFYCPEQRNVVYAKAKLKVMRSSIIIMRQARCMKSLTRIVI